MVHLDMTTRAPLLKSFVTAFLLGTSSAGAVEHDDELDALFAGLANPEMSETGQIENRIYEIWSQSGSPAMDLILERGQRALAEGDAKTSIDHFSALIDHAPNFAEAYNGRATAWFQLGKYGLSLEDIARTVDLNPRHFGALSGLALILEELGNKPGALEAWRRVQALHPTREGMDDAMQRLEREVEGETL